MAYPKQKQEKREINVEQVAAFLQNAFNWATKHLGASPGVPVYVKNSTGTKLHDYQQEMAWLIHEITNGPKYIAPKHIVSANELIDKIVEEGKLSDQIKSTNRLLVFHQETFSINCSLATASGRSNRLTIDRILAITCCEYAGDVSFS